MSQKIELKAACELIEKYHMLDAAEKVLCAVSGGADSMCLLVFLSEILPKKGVQLAAAHFNHKLRGDESERDERFVSDFCESRGIELIVGSADVASLSKQSGRSVEDAARHARYAFLEKTARELGADRIATAHTVDDQLETILMNLARGSGTKGLAGIPPVRGMIIRPFLAVGRDEILSYLAERQIPHVEDSTNELDDAARNAVRHKVVPALKDIYPFIADNAFRASQLIRADDEFLDELSEKRFSAFTCSEKEVVVAIEALASEPAPIMSRLVILAGKRFGISLSQTHVESVLRLALSSDPSASLSLPEGLKAYRKYSKLHFSKEIEGTRSFPETELIPGQWVEIKELGRAFFLSSDADTSKINGSFNIFFFKKRAVCGKILVRPRKTGDTFKPDPRGCRKTLKKLFIEKKIPLSERELIFVVADDTGVLFVEGFGADERVLNDPGDERIAVAVKNI